MKPNTDPMSEFSLRSKIFAGVMISYKFNDDSELDNKRWPRLGFYLFKQYFMWFKFKL